MQQSQETRLAICCYVFVLQLLYVIIRIETRSLFGGGGGGKRGLPPLTNFIPPLGLIFLTQTPHAFKSACDSPHSWLHIPYIFVACPHNSCPVSHSSFVVGCSNIRPGKLHVHNNLTFASASSSMYMYVWLGSTFQRLRTALRNSAVPMNMHGSY